MLLSLIILFLIAIFLRFPVAFAIAIPATITIVLFSDIPLIVIVPRMVIGIDSFVFMAIPLFVLSGRLMNAGGITDRIFSFARALVGHQRGGLGHANVVASMIFSGMSGSAVADAGGLGQVELKAMNDQGFPLEFSAAVTVASCVIGPVIPPSIPMVIYGGLAEVSVGRLFLGGIVPGILVGVSLMVLIYLLSVKNKYPRDPRVTIKEFIQRASSAFLPGLTPIIILGGILGGVFTPTEAAAVAVIYSFILSFFVYRSIKIRDLPGIFLDTIITTSMVTFIISTSNLILYLMLQGYVSERLVALVSSATMNPLIILLILNIVLIFFGCIMDPAVTIILLVPILVPLLHKVGINLVHFGVLMTLNLMIGVATPPVGMGLFVVSQVSGLPLEKLMKSILIFLIPEIVVLFVITYIPQIVLWIPNMVFGK